VTGASVRDFELARWLYQSELRAGTDAPAAASPCTAVDAFMTGKRVFVRMQGNLSRWFGTDGFNALLVRTIERTRAVYPLLSLAYPIGVVDITLPVNVLQANSAPTYEAASEASVAAIAGFIALLARLVGDNMAVHLVEEIWPNALPALVDGASRWSQLNDSGVAADANEGGTPSE
jgi:hypothetical protein